MVVALIVILAYLLGSIPFGYLVAKSRGIDIRQHGSGNIGATNVWRVVGKKYGLTTFLLDMGKGLAAVILGKLIAADRFPHDWAGIAAAMGCIVGHSFPVWLKFKGGKGVATSLGVIFGMMPHAALLDFLLWGIVFKVSGYVSLASVVAAFALPIIVFGLMIIGWLHGWGYFSFAVVAAFLVIWRHRENLKRLAAGTESSFKKKPPVEGPPPPPEEPPTVTP